MRRLKLAQKSVGATLFSDELRPSHKLKSLPHLLCKYINTRQEFQIINSVYSFIGRYGMTAPRRRWYVNTATSTTVMNTHETGVSSYLRALRCCRMVSAIKTWSQIYQYRGRRTPWRFLKCLIQKESILSIIECHPLSAETCTKRTAKNVSWPIKGIKLHFCILCIGWTNDD